MILIDKSKRWETFKVRKHEAVKNYIRAKRKQMRAEIICKALFLHKIINVLCHNFKEANRRFEMKLKGRFMVLMIAQAW